MEEKLEYEITGKSKAHPNVALIVILSYQVLMQDAIKECLQIPGIDYVEVRKNG